MCDPYMVYERVKRRLLSEYRKHPGSFIIAFDYDDTVFDTHDNGWTYDEVISLLRDWQRYAYLICWTVSKEERYPEIYNHLQRVGIQPDAINKNAPWIEDRGPKIFANALLDDRAGLDIIYRALREIFEEEIRHGKNKN